MNLNGKLLRSACYSNTQFVNQIVTESAKRKKNGHQNCYTCVTRKKLNSLFTKLKIVT